MLIFSLDSYREITLVLFYRGPKMDTLQIVKKPIWRVSISSL